VTYDVAIESLEGRIPAYWKIVPFRRLASLVDVTNANSSAPLLSLASTGIIVPREEFDGLGRQTPAESTIERYWLAKPGNLVVNPMWLAGGGIGVSEIFGAVSPDYRVYRLGPDLYPRYVHHLLRSQPYRDQYRLYTRAETTFDRRVSKVDFHAMPLVVPPLDEQRRIADFLDAETARIDGLTALRNCQADLLDDRYRTAISEFVTPGISSARERDERWPWLPAKILTSRLGYAAMVQTGITVDSKREITDDDAEYPYLRVANVQGEHIDLSEIKTITVPRSVAIRSTLISGDLVMTEANGNPDNLGRGAVWHGEVPGMVHQNHIFVIRADPAKLMPEYLSALLASDHGRRYFRTTSTQVGIATTSSSKVLDFPVPLLPMHEQRRVVTQCEEARTTISRSLDALTRQLALLAERRQALITAAVTGGITV
jgi:type I restriction enzyme S subunit